MTEDIEIEWSLENNANKIMKCPECDHRLPIDAYTECDNCGAHLEVKVETVVGAIGENNE